MKFVLPTERELQYSPGWNTARHSGSALIVCLLVLVVVLLLGTSTANIALQEQKASRVDLDRQLAMESAEAALDDAEQDIERSARRHIFSSSGTDSFPQQCDGYVQDQYRGLCLSSIAGGVPAWQLADLTGDEGELIAVSFGQFTGRTLQIGDGILPAVLPRYIIELVPYMKTGAVAGGEAPSFVYRITAVGFGMRNTTTVVLQTFYRKAVDNGAENHMPKGRLSWREISNWKELHDASTKG